MKKKWIRMISMALTVIMIFGSVMNVFAGSVDDSTDASAASALADDEVEQNIPSDENSDSGNENQEQGEVSNGQDTSGDQDASKAQGTSSGDDTSAAGSDANNQEQGNSDISGTVTTDSN